MSDERLHLTWFQTISAPLGLVLIVASIWHCNAPESVAPEETHHVSKPLPPLAGGSASPELEPTEPLQLTPIPADLARQMESGDLTFHSAVVPPKEVLDNRADPGCVRAVAKFMRGLTTTPEGAIAIDHYPKGSTASQIVFRNGHTRYAIYTTGESATGVVTSWLSYWERPEGTTAEETVIIYIDSGFDGIVDFGIGHALSGGFHSGGDGGAKPKGLKSWPYWQNKYVSAVEATVAQFHLSCGGE